MQRGFGCRARAVRDNLAVLEGLQEEEALVREVFDLRPYGIVKMLDLIRPIYSKTASYGHFGREESEFSWEKTDKAEQLRTLAGL